MILVEKYIFKSERLGFRNWSAGDLDDFAGMNADQDVMEHFPSTLNLQQTAELIGRLQDHYATNGYTYFATEILETGELIGFIGLAHHDYDSEFNPATDIGWRLKKSAWGNGYATEGAKRCLEFAFDELKLKKVIAICTIQNKKSEAVMIKIGMTKKGEFEHPKLKEFPDYARCMWYEIEPKAKPD